MKIFSNAFAHGEAIPTLYTCESKDISVPLSWKDIPKGTKSLVLIVDDPDAPDPEAPKMVWVHWILYNIDPQSTGLAENIQSDELPTGTLVGTNSWGKQEYGGPCPPIGRHRYFHKLYALDCVLPDLQNPSVEKLKAAMEGHLIEEAVMVGTYIKK